MDAANEMITRASENVNKKMENEQVRQFGFSSLGGYIVGWLILTGYFRMALAAVVTLALVGTPNMAKVQKDIELLRQNGFTGVSSFSKDFVAVSGAVCGFVLCSLSYQKLFMAVMTAAAYLASGY